MVIMFKLYLKCNDMILLRNVYCRYKIMLSHYVK